MGARPAFTKTTVGRGFLSPETGGQPVQLVCSKWHEKCQVEKNRTLYTMDNKALGFYLNGIRRH